MNVYEKLQKCRVELQRTNLKKSGHNKFAGYEYFELGDFLPKINELMLENNLCSSIKFDKEMATLEIVNIEKLDEVITFTSPLADAQLKGCHPVQNLGAVQTYIRRYLYTNAFEIVEHDALDARVGADKPESKPQQSKTEQEKEFLLEILSLEQSKRLFAIAKGNNELVKKVIGQYGYESSKTILKSDYEKISKEIEDEVNKAS